MFQNAFLCLVYMKRMCDFHCKGKNIFGYNKPNFHKISLKIFKN